MLGDKPAVHLLLVEDETVYSRMILYQLSKLEFTEHTLSINHVSSLTELKEIKDFLTPDIILLDLGLPETSGSDTFIETKSIFPESAVIILTGTDDDLLANNIVKKGAQDYLVKSDADSKVLRKTIEYALDRFEFQHAMTDSALKYRDLFQNSPTPLFLFNSNRQKIRVVNAALGQLMECPDDDVLIATLEKQMEHILTAELLQNFNFSLEVLLRTCRNNDFKVMLVASKLKSKEDAFVCQFIPILQETGVPVEFNRQKLAELSEKVELLKIMVKEQQKSDSTNLDPVLNQINEIQGLLIQMQEN